MKIHLGLIGLGAPALALGAGALFGAASAHAETTIEFPCGQACENSTLDVTIADNARSVTKTYTTKDGTVRTRVSGKGPDLTFFNPNDPSVTFETKGNGSNNWTEVYPDGTSTVTTTGHTVWIFYPADTLASGEPGPATQLTTGRTVVSNDANGISTTVFQKGRVTDICAKLPAD